MAVWTSSLTSGQRILVAEVALAGSLSYYHGGINVHQGGLGVDRTRAVGQQEQDIDVPGVFAGVGDGNFARDVVHLPEPEVSGACGGAWWRYSMWASPPRGQRAILSDRSWKFRISLRDD